MIKRALIAAFWSIALSHAVLADNNTGPFPPLGVVRGTGGFVAKTVTTASELVNASNASYSLFIRNESATASLVVCSKLITQTPVINQAGCYTLSPGSTLLYPNNSNYLPNDDFYAACASGNSCSVTVEIH